MSKLYRYEISYSSPDYSRTRVILKEYEVVRETEKSYFINYQPYKIKRVSKEAYNTFAYDTKKGAKDHFERRTQKRISWYKYWIDECEKALKISQEGKEEK